MHAVRSGHTKHRRDDGTDSQFMPVNGHLPVLSLCLRRDKHSLEAGDLTPRQDMHITMLRIGLRLGLVSGFVFCVKKFPT